jgi:hypothetical protein
MAALVVDLLTDIDKGNGLVGTSVEGSGLVRYDVQMAGRKLRNG